jgi:hypothetical protein
MAARAFPPLDPGDPHQRVIEAISRFPLGKRRHRAYPRVIKRYGPCYRPIKRAHHQQTLYEQPPTIEITAA